MGTPPCRQGHLPDKVWTARNDEGSTCTTQKKERKSSCQKSEQCNGLVPTPNAPGHQMKTVNSNRPFPSTPSISFSTSSFLLVSPRAQHSHCWSSLLYDRPLRKGRAENFQGHELPSLQNIHARNRHCSEDILILAAIIRGSPILLNSNFCWQIHGCRGTSGFPECDTAQEFLSLPRLVNRSQHLGEKLLLHLSQRSIIPDDTRPQKQNALHSRVQPCP